MTVYRLVGMVIILVSFGFGWLWMAYQNAVDSALSLEQPAHFEISKGDSFKRVIQKLHSQGILTKPFYFSVLGKLENATSRLKVGDYKIVPGTTARQLLSMMVEGKVHQYSLTLIEGWTFRRVLQTLEETPQLRHTLKNRSIEEVMSLVGAANEHPEGRFFPDTYFFAGGTTDIAILKRAYESLKQTISSEWSKRAEGLPLKTPYQALILASIVEKETGVSGERPIIAGVFIRRLQKGMLLQTDPTVIYGIGKRYNGNITLKHLRTDTPYNTYVRRGLPPTPIAMAGSASIHAVLHPKKGNSLYFVARGDGTHVFSSTLKEHNRAVKTFQLRKKKKP